MTRRHWLSNSLSAIAVVSVRDHGATGKGEQLESPAIQKAIDSAAQSGGGTVYIPAGRYLCGTLQLRSNISLWLDNGATLVMSGRPGDFRPPETLPYDPHSDGATSHFQNALIFGEDCRDIALYGEGRIECAAASAARPKPVSFRRCTGLSIRGITIDSASNYNISLLGCDSVVIDGVTIRNGTSDGIDPDCCRRVRISNCFVESVDDAIVLKASGALGERRSTEHVTVTNCVLRTASLFLKCGTESEGDFRNIAFSNCTLIGGMGNRHGNPGIGLYTVDGGTLEGIAISNITMQNVGIPLAIRRGARGRGQTEPVAGPLRDVTIANVVATGARRPSVIAGLSGFPVEGVTVADIRISMTERMDVATDPAAIPEKAGDYPDPTMFGNLPASGLYARHCAGLTLRNLELRPHPDDRRAALLFDDVEKLRGSGVRTGLTWMNQVRDAAWLDCERLGSGPVLRVSGEVSSAIALRSFSERNADDILLDSNVRTGAVRRN